jgi:uroporphyrinogen-III synthase
MTLPLTGRRVGITADRKREIQRKLFEARGAEVVEGPTMATHYLPGDEGLRAVTASVVAEPPAVVVADTGVGVNAWFEAAAAWGLGDGLRQALVQSEILARGPKAASAIRKHTDVAAVTAPESRLDGFRAHLAEQDLAGRRVVVQRSGTDDEPFIEWLGAKGATVVSVEVYRWELPADREPALELVRQACDGRLDAVTFTSAPGVGNLFVLGAELGLEADLRTAFASRLVGACVGPVCAEAARRAGVAAPIYSTTGHLTEMVRLVTEVLAPAG